MLHEDWKLYPAATFPTVNFSSQDKRWRQSFHNRLSRVPLLRHDLKVLPYASPMDSRSEKLPHETKQCSLSTLFCSGYSPYHFLDINVVWFVSLNKIVSGRLKFTSVLLKIEGTKVCACLEVDRTLSDMKRRSVLRWT